MLGLVAVADHGDCMLQSCLQDDSEEEGEGDDEEGGDDGSSDDADVSASKTCHMHVLQAVARTACACCSRRMWPALLSSCAAALASRLQCHTADALVVMFLAS